MELKQVLPRRSVDCGNEGSMWTIFPRHSLDISQKGHPLPLSFTAEGKVSTDGSFVRE